MLLRSNRNGFEAASLMLTNVDVIADLSIN
jgi:hypothetical protein